MAALNSGTLNTPAQLNNSTGQSSTQPPQLKYSAEIKSISGCPPTSCTGAARVGFRFAPAKLSHEAFLPVALIKPQRILKGRPITQCCTGYSLSLYQSLDQLKKRAEAGIKTSPLFLKRIGDHFVRMTVGPQDGVSSVAAADGHFDFFEYVAFKGLDSVEEHGALML